MDLPRDDLGAAERLFGLAGLDHDGEATRATMRLRPAHAGPDGRISLGTLGTLIDLVLGFALVSQRPAGHWQVSVEITMDAHQSIPTEGVLVGEGRVLHRSDIGGFATGSVRDEAGRLLVTGTQRGRYVPAVEEELRQRPRIDLPEDHGHLADLLGLDLATGDLEVAPHLTNPLGNLHGGVSLAAADLITSAAVGPELSTQSIHLVYPRAIPATGSIQYAARVDHRGRTLATTSVVGSAAGRIANLARVTSGPAF